MIRQAHATDCNDTVEFKLRPLVVPQDARLEVMVRVEPLSVPESITLTVLGRKAITWTRSDGGLVREGTTDVAIVPGPWTALDDQRRRLRFAAGGPRGRRDAGQKGGIVDWDQLATARVRPWWPPTRWSR